jgi:hypothetical protein
VPCRCGSEPDVAARNLEIPVLRTHAFGFQSERLTGGGRETTANRTSERAAESRPGGRAEERDSDARDTFQQSAEVRRQRLQAWPNFPENAAQELIELLFGGDLEEFRRECDLIRFRNRQVLAARQIGRDFERCGFVCL